MTKRVRRIVWVLGGFAVVLALAYLLQLQLAFVNRGQEFGAYGHYNRALRVIGAMDDYKIVGHRVRRKLELAHIFHVEEFSLKLRDKAGRIAEIHFEKGTAEMKERDDAALRAIIRAKYDRALAQREP